MNHDSSAFFSLDERIAAWSVSALVCLAIWACSGALHAQTSAHNASDALPYNDPQPLQELLTLDDTQLQNRLNNDWDNIRQTLDRFFPPGTAVAMPMAFTGSQSECLGSRTVNACRVYLGYLTEINKEKRPQGGGMLSNPLAPT